MSALITLFYIYDPWLFHILRMAFFVGIIALGIMLYKWYKRELNTIVLPIDSFGVLIGLIIVAWIPAWTYGTQDFSVALMYVKSLILFSIGVMIYMLFYVNRQHKLIVDLQIGIGVQTWIGLFALLGVPWVIDLALSSHVVLTRFYGSEQEYRLYHFTSSAFFQLSLFYGFLLHFLMAYQHKTGRVNHIILLALLFLGVLSGRTFLVMAVISFLIYFNWRYLPILTLFAVSCLLFVFYYSEQRYIAHALEPIIKLIYKPTGNIAHISHSTDTLIQKHLFIPTLKQILIGDGFYYAKTGGYYGATDSGFLRQLLYGGIGYLVVCFSVTAYFVVRVANNWFNGSWRFILSTLAIFSLLNIKADTYAFPGIMFVLLMFLSLFGDTGKWYVVRRSVKKEEGEKNV